MLKLYNTLTRKKEVFKPIKQGLVGMYTCGPTVYWYQHIGNLRTYIFEDILQRVLSYNGYKVKRVLNITDVGHLTSDADEGEDKMVKALKREGLSLTKESMLKLAKIYTDDFKQSFKKLNLLDPEIWCKATEHVKEMIELIKRIEKNNYTYLGKNGNVYFDASKFKDYEKLAKLKLEELKAGARIEIDPDKKNPRDFVLWFSTGGSKFKDHLFKWPSPWGEGWPGWHIECSAMSIKYLGEQFDIHCGGIDHISVHHTNEIAQSEAATGKKPWVKYWLHGHFLVFKGEKVSKSTGGLYTVTELEKKGYPALAYKYFCLNTHYRKPLNYSIESLDSAKNGFERLKNNVIEIKENIGKGASNKKGVEKYKEEFIKYINDDLNMPKVMALVWDLLKDTKISNREKYDLLIDFDLVLGLDIKNMAFERVEVSSEIEGLIQKREDARKQNNYELADRIRNELKEKGIILEDTPKGIRWKKV